MAGNGKEFVGETWENVRIRMPEVGKEEDIPQGVFAQSMRPAEEKTKCLEILGRQDLRLPQRSGVSLLGMSTSQQHLDSAHWLCSQARPCISHSLSGPQSPHLEKEVYPAFSQDLLPPCFSTHRQNDTISLRHFSLFGILNSPCASVSASVKGE